jgi:hypothetical protein
MKASLIYLKNHLICFAVAGLLMLSAGAAQAQILLTIQLSGNEATITATGTDPLTSASIPMTDGVDLLNLFVNSAGDTAFTVNSTGLTTGDASSGPVFTQAFADIFEATGNNDLNLYDLSSGATLTFTPGDAAFTGTMTVDLGSALPINSSGEIVTGFSGSGAGRNVDIGSWQVVSTAPEPSSWVLLMGGMALLAFYRVAWIRSKVLR